MSKVMSTWHGYTPDGRELVVHREPDSWVVRCGSSESRNRILDVAMIEAIRSGNAVVHAHAQHTEYAAWVRAQAAQIEEELSDGPER
jgi:hypothetical protein